MCDLDALVIRVLPGDALLLGLGAELIHERRRRGRVGGGNSNHKLRDCRELTHLGRITRDAAEGHFCPLEHQL